MATTTRSREIDPELMTSRMFAQVFQAYVECTAEIQSLIRDMVEIVNDPSATEDEKLMACSTIAESLFPSRHHGQMGVDLEQAERLDVERSREIKDVHASMDRQEEHFADRVLAPMRERDMTQAQLANACEIGQPAVSNLLSRRSRPQRRTVEKIARSSRCRNVRNLAGRRYAIIIPPRPIPPRPPIEAGAFFAQSMPHSMAQPRVRQVLEDKKDGHTTHVST